MHHSSFARPGARSRSTGTLRSRVLHTVVALAATLGFAAQAAAQAGSVAGTVTGAGGAPLPGAQVRVDGTDRATATDASGRFRFSGLSGEEVTLEVRRIGYRPARVRARLGEQNLRVSLTEQSVSLAEVVVTGTAGGQTRREIGNAVTTVNAAEVSERGTVNNIQQMLNARAPGVFINAASGNVGTGARIRIRGASSLSLSNEPLIYVDGVRINNSPATGPVNQGFGSTSFSRLNDINPDEIETIEIIRGPAAATLYGTEASNGVIQIITKRGAAGRPRWTFSTRQGTNYLQDYENRWPTNYQTIPRLDGQPGRDTVAIDIMASEEARGRPVFENGRISEYDLSASGGSELFRYFASGGLEDSDGIEPTNTVRRRNARVNLAVTPSRTLDFGFNVGYVNGNSTLPCEAGCGGRTWTTMSANPQNFYVCENATTGAEVVCSSTAATTRIRRDASGNPVLNLRRGHHSGLPEAYDAYYEFYQIVDRFTGGLQINQQLRPWLRHRLTAGTDRTREENSELGRRTEDSLFRSVLGLSANGALGYREILFREVNNYTFDYSASAVFDPLPEIRSTTSFGSQYYRNRYQVSCVRGEQFPAANVFTVGATTNRPNCVQGVSTAQDIEEDATLGFFLQEQIGWRDRLFLTAAVRADDNSAFGRDFNRVYYPKFSVAWVLSEEPFWRFPMVDALKLRAAYGEAGKQPITFSALQTYTSAAGPNNTPTVTPLSIGNPALGPERSKEIELGFDAGAWQDRVGLEFTYYRKRTIDAILDRQIAPSLGIPGTQPFNAGSLKNWGTETLLRIRPIETQRFDWQTTLGYATNDSRIEDLGTAESILELRRQSTCPGYVPGTTNPSTCPVDDFVLASTGTLPPRHQVGFPIGSYFNRRIVSASFNPSGGAVSAGNAADTTQRIVWNVKCDDGKGGSMPCGSAPFVYLGRSVPRIEGSFGNSFTFFGNLRAYALIDFKRDYQKVDGTLRVRCVVNIRCREAFYPREFDPVLIAGVAAGLDVLPDFYINDASYTRLREVSLSYTLPPLMTERARIGRAVVSLAGRNLKLWTDYTGLDPEAFFLGGTRGGSFSLFDQTTNPQATQWVLSLNLDW